MTMPRQNTRTADQAQSEAEALEQYQSMNPVPEYQGLSYDSTTHRFEVLSKEEVETIGISLD